MVVKRIQVLNRWSVTMKICPKCNGKNIDSGMIRTAGIYMQRAYDPDIYYVSYKKKIFAQKTPIEAFACLDCGYVEHYISPSHLKERIKGEFESNKNQQRLSLSRESIKR